MNNNQKNVLYVVHQPSRLTEILLRCIANALYVADLNYREKKRKIGFVHLTRII